MIGSSLFRSSPYWLNFLFAGQMYSWDYKFSVGAGASVYYQVKTGANWMFHTLSRTVSVEAGGPYRVELYEAPTVTDGTIQQLPYNMNRKSAKTAEPIIYINPTGVSGGTLLEKMFLPTGGGPKTSGELAAGISERVLKPSTNYVVKITNSGGAAGTAMINLLFYESGN